MAKQRDPAPHQESPNHSARRIMPRRLLSLLSCALLASACHSGTEPTLGSEAGMYVARSLGTEALPAITDSSSAEYGVLLADTLELDGHGGARRAFAFRRVSSATGTDEVYHPAFALSYRRSGARLEIGSFTPCPPNAQCVGNEIGELSDAGLLLVTNHYSADQSVSFERVQ